MPTIDQQNRQLALTTALREWELLGRHNWREPCEHVSATIRFEVEVHGMAERWLAWLRGPVHLQVTFGPIVNQQTGLPTGNTHTGGPMSIELLDDEQVDVTIRPRDGKGFESSDALVYEVADSSVVAVVGGDDSDTQTFTAVAGNPGVTSIKVTDPTATDPATGEALSALIAVEVAAAGAKTLDVEVGTPVKQPVAEPPAGGGDTGSGDTGSGDTGGSEPPAGDV